MIGIIVKDIGHIWNHFREKGFQSTVGLLHSREAPGTAQFVKYSICGAAATIVHHGIVFLLSYTLIPAMEGMMVNGLPITDEIRTSHLIINNAIAFPFANITAYVLNAMWVFTGGRHSRWKEFWLFTAVAAISFAAGLFGGPLLIRWLGISTYFAQGGFLITSVLVNYVCRKLFIFAK